MTVSMIQTTFIINIILIVNVIAFNLDVTSPVVKQVQSTDKNFNNYFGYSVAQHLTKDGKYILVGAPKDSYKSYNMSGAIYKCPFNLKEINDCVQIEVDFSPKNSDESDDKNYDYSLQEQFKGTKLNGQWFGVSISSTGDGQFSACAHKYVHYYNFTRRDEHASYGACFTFSNSFKQQFKHVPCLLYTHEVGLNHANNYAYCQAGTSMVMTKGPQLGDSYEDDEDSFISFGMPSALNFRGLVGLRNSRRSEFVYGNGSRLCRFNPLTDTPGYRGQGYCGNLWEKYSYLGMSHTVISNYRGKFQENVIAAGAPRDNLNGVIRFFTNTYDLQFGGAVTRKLSNILTGPSKGSYFGFSIVACDVNGDQIEDLIVGAPYYSRNTYEPNAGAIYIYINDEKKGFSNMVSFNYTGKSRSLFGHSIACIGDIDKDGVNDFAVGAPYESDGAVYIFRGNSDIGKIKMSQKLNAKDINHDLNEDLKGFGYSLSGGQDMDSNKYPDLAIGVLKTNAVLVLRSRPIVRIKTFIENYEILQEIDQKKKECFYAFNGISTAASCFKVSFCFELDSFEANRILNFSITAEHGSLHSRVFFIESNNNILNSSINVNNDGERTCSSVQLVFKKDTYDFITPIPFLIQYNFANDKEAIPRENLRDINDYPVVHEDTNEFEFKANFKTECGSNKNCNSDLQLHASFANLTVDDENISILSFKESDVVGIKVELKNFGEPAYATEISIKFDERLDFIRKDDIVQNSFSCAKKPKESVLNCKMTNELGGVPFQENHSIEFMLTFSSTRLYRSPNTSNHPDVKFDLNASTLSVDTNSKNNKVSIFARFKVRANLFLYGKRTPEQLFYGDNYEIKGESAIKKIEEIGPIIEHTYKINNGGPFSVESFQLIIDWPHETRLSNLNQLRHGKHLLYLIEKPTKIPNNHPINVICTSYEVDPLNLAEKKFQKRSVDYQVNVRKLVETPAERTAVIDCFSGTAFCQRIICNFHGDLSKDETISLKFTARVWNATLVEDYKDYEKVLIKSHGKLVLNEKIHDDNQEDNEHSVTTLAYSNVIVKSDQKLPIWIYVISVLIGLLLLLLCIIGFWMVGFFERKKYGDEKYLEESEKIKKTPY